MLAFAAAVFFLIITPGPGVLSTAGVAAGFGVRTATRYVFGLFLGNNLVSLMVISGLSALVMANSQFRTILFAISLLYLGYMALRIAFAGSKIGFIQRAAPPGIKGGIFLQIVNPKAYIVGTTLFTGFAFLPDSYWVEVTTKLLIFNIIWAPIHFLWLFLGIYLHNLNPSERAQTVINFAMASSMLIVVLLAAFHQSQGL